VDTPPRAWPGFLAMVKKYVNPRLSGYRDDSHAIRDIGIFGADARRIVSRLTGVAPDTLGALAQFDNVTSTVHGAEVLIARVPDLGVEGYDLFVPFEIFDSAWSDAVAAGAVRPGPARRRPTRPLGTSHRTRPSPNRRRCSRPRAAPPRPPRTRPTSARFSWMPPPRGSSRVRRVIQGSVAFVSPLCHSLFSRVESVSQPSYADKDAWLGRVGFDLLAQARDLVIDDSVRHMSLTAPNFVQQPFPGHQSTGMAHEGAE